MRIVVYREEYPRDPEKNTVNLKDGKVEVSEHEIKTDDNSVAAAFLRGLAEKLDPPKTAYRN